MDIHSHLTNVLGDYDAAPLNERRWDYMSIDTRITGGIMYFTYQGPMKTGLLLS
jgi:hypothetical protein